MTPPDLARTIKEQAYALGFDLVAIAPAGPSPDYDRYVQWLASGYGGEMGYLARHMALKADPRLLWPEATSVILVGLNYHQSIVSAWRQDPSRGQIASYALLDDYHDIMVQALIELDSMISAYSKRRNRGRDFVDSAPVLERSWGMQAGLGFIGRNTCLIHPSQGSYLFLGGLLIPEETSYDPPPLALEERTHQSWRFSEGSVGTCGRCRRCLDICPTQAFPSPYVLDARRCISYLTIELREDIPTYLRSGMRNWVFGCDLCQEVCPWNHQAPGARHPLLSPHQDRIAPHLLDLLALSPADFAQRFSKSPIKRTKWLGFMRNCCVAAGNWGDPQALPALEKHLCDSPPLVAVHAAWALAQLREGVGIPRLQQASQMNLAKPVQDAVLAALVG